MPRYESKLSGWALRYHAVPEVYDTQGNPRYGFGPRVTAQPGDVKCRLMFPDKL